VVARNEQRLNALAIRLRVETGVKVDVLIADLTSRVDVPEGTLDGVHDMANMPLQYEPQRVRDDLDRRALQFAAAS